jgi:hypothetical protein
VNLRKAESVLDIDGSLLYNGMTDTQLIKCSSCKCNREPSAFKVNKKGGLFKTCIVCNERRRKIPDNKLTDIADVKLTDIPDSKLTDIADVKLTDIPDIKLTDIPERGRTRQRKIADEYRDTRVSSRAEDELFTMLEEMMPPGMDWRNRTEWYIGFDIDINALDKDGHLPRGDEVLRRLRMHNLRPMWLDPSAHK